MRKRALRSMVPVLALLGIGAACAPSTPENELPTPEELRAHFATSRGIRVELNGNVAELSVSQPADGLRRGGATWAKVGPYIYLFTSATMEAFQQWPGLAAVRVTTRAEGGGGNVASALLRRDTLNPVTWKRALQVSGLARRDGTERPTRVIELIRYGERTADSFEYSPRYVRGS